MFFGQNIFTSCVFHFLKQSQIHIGFNIMWQYWHNTWHMIVISVWVLICKLRKQSLANLSEKEFIGSVLDHRSQALMGRLVNEAEEMDRKQGKHHHRDSQLWSHCKVAWSDLHYQTWGLLKIVPPEKTLKTMPLFCPHIQSSIFSVLVQLTEPRLGTFTLLPTLWRSGIWFPSVCQFTLQWRLKQGENTLHQLRGNFG